MSLQESIASMEAIMEAMKVDLHKVETNKSAAARVRKQSFEFAKVAKIFRAESVDFHR